MSDLDDRDQARPQAEASVGGADQAGPPEAEPAEWSEASARPATESVESAAPTDEVDNAVIERDEFLNDLRRLQADFENYKKRVIKQQTELLERAAEALVVKLLPVIDSLDLAVAHANSSDENDAKALVQVAAVLNDILVKEGLERIEPLGQPFDPTAHEAVMHEEGGGDPEVTEVLRAGFRWKGRVIRPAMVKVKG